ncbi:MAG: calcineurin-like phosphoesterase C-terminal domain-containing protein [Luteimonas sp.]|nr:calcineurin-like phosphoesterase C-terminal domain-containing protein [Luteimonas sp.]
MQAEGLFAAALLASITFMNDPVDAARNGCTGQVLEADGGQGVAGQLVSDGRRVVATDVDGRYVLPAIDAKAQVSVIARDGWAVPAREDGLPAFWRTGCGDFELVEATSPSLDGHGADTRVLVFSDPQTSTEVQVGHYARGIVGAARNESGIALGITLGDVSDDVPELYPALNRATALLGVPWLHVAGNHDVDVDARDDEAALSAFRAVYGPDTHAWETERAVFVVLDNVVSMPGQRPAYVGGLREDQFAFLESYLPLAPRDRLLVVAVHIPWFDTAAPGRPSTVRVEDRERLFALLRDFPHVLLLSGHRHTQRQFFHGSSAGWNGEGRLREYNVGAASGAYWSGVDDASGIPVSTMADGTPKGYAVLTIRDGGGYALAWRPVGIDGDDPAFTDAMALHAPKVLRRGAYPAWGVYANVFMGHDDTRVEYRIDGGEWKPMMKVEAPDPRLLAENVRDDLADALRSYDRSPEAEPSTHLWRGALDTRLPTGEHEVEVRVFDDEGIEHRARTAYRLDEWSE